MKLISKSLVLNVSPSNIKKHILAIINPLTTDITNPVGNVFNFPIKQNDFLSPQITGLAQWLCDVAKSRKVCTFFWTKAQMKRLHIHPVKDVIYFDLKSNSVDELTTKLFNVVNTYYDSDKAKQPN